MSNNYEPIIGLEIHAELNTKTKMFCRCKNDPFHSEPNTHICPVCLGLPGALPVANQAALEATVMVGLALNCQIAAVSKWDRKHYFYPDLPKGYQISQYDLPLCKDGYLSLSSPTGSIHDRGSRSSIRSATLPVKDDIKNKIRITRIHLEEDTGTLQHPKGANYSLVNYNRSGVPLLELVTEPDLRSGKEARSFAQEYQRILRSLGAGNADMEKGEMRVEVNISLRQIPSSKSQITTLRRALASLPRLAQGIKELTGEPVEPYGTKVEIKNLNSFRSVEKSIDYEIKRQIEILESGQAVVQETRGWHDGRQVTFSQRTKEEAADYRYFPEPDLPPLALSSERIEAIRSQMPALPEEKRRHYKELGLNDTDAEVFVDDTARGLYFEVVLTSLRSASWRRSNLKDRHVVDTPRDDKKLAKLVADWTINIVPDMSVNAEDLAELLILVDSGEVSTSMAKELLVQMKATGQSARSIVEQKGLAQISDPSAIEAIVDQILVNNPTQVNQYRAGKEQVFSFLVGQVMREAKGQANPKLLNEILKRKLGPVA